MTHVILAHTLSINYILSQSKYIVNILEHANIYDIISTNSNLELNVKYYPFDDVPLLNPMLYCVVVGRLMCLVITTHDIFL